MSCECVILCDIASLQILHDVKKTQKTENKYTLIFLRKTEHCSAMQQGLRQKVFVARHMSIVARQKNLAIR